MEFKTVVCIASANAFIDQIPQSAIYQAPQNLIGVVSRKYIKAH